MAPAHYIHEKQAYTTRASQSYHSALLSTSSTSRLLKIQHLAKICLQDYRSQIGTGQGSRTRVITIMRMLNSITKFYNFIGEWVRIHLTTSAEMCKWTVGNSDVRT
jgi:site-specific recombinase XerD